VWPIFDAAQSRDFRKVRRYLSFFLLTWDSHSSSCETHTLCLSGLECTKNFDAAQSHNFCKVRSHLLSSSSHWTHIPNHVQHTLSICLVLYALGTLMCDQSLMLHNRATSAKYEAFYHLLPHHVKQYSLSGLECTRSYNFVVSLSNFIFFSRWTYYWSVSAWIQIQEHCLCCLTCILH
jgi:hypothetical protein